MKTRELWEGINGSGRKTWTVATLVDGKVTWMERFTSEAEARNWMRWT